MAGANKNGCQVTDRAVNGTLQNFTMHGEDVKLGCLSAKIIINTSTGAIIVS